MLVVVPWMEETDGPTPPAALCLTTKGVLALLPSWLLTTPYQRSLLCHGLPRTTITAPFPPLSRVAIVAPPPSCQRATA